MYGDGKIKSYFMEKQFPGIFLFLRPPESRKYVVVSKCCVSVCGRIITPFFLPKLMFTYNLLKLFNISYKSYFKVY